MSEILIEKGIPVPRSARNGAAYPFSKLEVGDSFIVPAEERGRARSAAHGYQRTHSGICLVTRTVEGGLAAGMACFV